jgi:hypothetical protein
LIFCPKEDKEKSKIIPIISFNLFIINVFLTYC